MPCCSVNLTCNRYIEEAQFTIHKPKAGSSKATTKTKLKEKSKISPKDQVKQKRKSVNNISHDKAKKSKVQHGKPLR